MTDPLQHSLTPTLRNVHPPVDCHNDGETGHAYHQFISIYLSVLPLFLSFTAMFRVLARMFSKPRTSLLLLWPWSTDEILQHLVYQSSYSWHQWPMMTTLSFVTHYSFSSQCHKSKRLSWHLVEENYKSGPSSQQSSQLLCSTSPSAAPTSHSVDISP